MFPIEENLPPDEGAWEIILAPIAKKRLAKIPQPDRGRILTAIIVTSVLFGIMKSRRGP